MLVKVRKLAIKQVPHRWPDIIRVLEKFVPALKVTQVCWNLPPDNWLKCNTDGVSRGNPGRSSYAFCIRDPLGDLMYAEAKETSEGTNTFSETIAILEEARYCVGCNVFNLILETDSLFLKNIITGIWKPPWSVTAELEEIGELLENLNVQVTHVIRGGNQLADYLANSALERGDIRVHSFNELDSQGRKIINSDNSQVNKLPGCGIDTSARVLFTEIVRRSLECGSICLAEKWCGKRRRMEKVRYRHVKGESMEMNFISNIHLMEAATRGLFTKIVRTILGRVLICLAGKCCYKKRMRDKITYHHVHGLWEESMEIIFISNIHLLLILLRKY
ncbi:hypothetical protein P3S67_008467 [Capsicum chacoense]